MATEIVVRKARTADAADIARIHVRAWQVGYSEIMTPEFLDGLDVEERGRQWEGGLARREPEPDGSSAMAAELDGRLVGICVYGDYRIAEGEDPVSAPPAELWMLNVDPEYWGTGVAQALDGHALEELADRWPGETAALWVLDGNARGRRFYEK